MNKRDFYNSKISHNNERIKKVYRAKAQVERLSNDIFSTYLSSAISSLGIVVAEILAENKKLEDLLELEPSNIACSGLVESSASQSESTPEKLSARQALSQPATNR